MSDLVSRLLEAIAASEQKALVAHPGPWSIYRGPECMVTYGEEARIVAKVFAGYDMRFIVDNDPASALRRCAGDRKVFWHHSSYYVTDDGQKICNGPGAERWPCVDFTALAERYGISVEEETTSE